MKACTARSLAWTLLAMTGAAFGQTPSEHPPETDEAQWQVLPRNSTVYVPVPRQVTPVDAYRSCANRNEGESCDFSTPREGMITGVCQAPQMRQPPAYGYEVQQYPAQVRTGLVCAPTDGQPPQAGGQPVNPGHETPYPPNSPTAPQL